MQKHLQKQTSFISISIEFEVCFQYSVVIVSIALVLKGGLINWVFTLLKFHQLYSPSHSAQNDFLEMVELIIFWILKNEGGPQRDLSELKNKFF